MLRTLGEAYKVLQLWGQNLPALEAFYWVTLGNARALGLEAEIGSLAEGREADQVVLDPAATRRWRTAARPSKATWWKLFLLMTLGDDRAVRATYVAGALAYRC